MDTRRRLIVGGMLGLGLAACSLTTSLEGLSGGALDEAREGGDGPLADRAAPGEAAAPDAEAGDADRADASMPNLVPNGDFETGCAPWGRFQSRLFGDPRGRTGQGCMVCYESGSGGFSIDSASTGPMNPPVGASYHAELWLRTVPGTARDVLLALRTHDEGPPFRTVEQRETDLVRLTESWQRLTVDLTVTQPAQYLSMYAFSVGAEPGACFLVDDATLIRTH